MGNEIKNILFGGVKVYHVEKADVKHDEKGNKTYCVWLEGGAYAEYPQQQKEPVVSYYAKEKNTDVIHQITEKTFKSNKTKKDGEEYEFKAISNDCPSIATSLVEQSDGHTYYEHTIDGLKDIKFVGSPHNDGIFLTNTSKAEIISDNDKEKDGVNIMINCKNIKYQIEDGLDVVSRWVGYDKGNGYFPKFESK